MHTHGVPLQIGFQCESFSAVGAFEWFDTNVKEFVPDKSTLTREAFSTSPTTEWLDPLMYPAVAFQFGILNKTFSALFALEGPRFFTSMATSYMKSQCGRPLGREIAVFTFEIKNVFVDRVVTFQPGACLE